MKLNSALCSTGWSSIRHYRLHGTPHIGPGEAGELVEFVGTAMDTNRTTPDTGEFKVRRGAKAEAYLVEA